MYINEVIKHVDLSKRAIKYYEEEGLLEVAKASNGYRDYSESDIATLKEISVYRKLGISIKDIKTLLIDPDKQLLKGIYAEKSHQLAQNQKELEALEHFIKDRNVDTIYAVVDYKSIAQAMQDMLPGFYGYFFMNHFMPYLQIQITTPEQQAAYKKIIEFWDDVTIKIPLFMKLSSYILFKTSKVNMEQITIRIDTQLKQLINPTDEEYEQLKNKTKKNVKMKNSLFFKYHPAFIVQRRFMKRLQDCGYNDLFIPNMILLSPKYKEYHQALSKINERICTDLGLYYDSKYNLIMKDET